jgi:NAD(P)-dependent dehydrogenase (short-subunit alcohol dehydrogenase family)
MTGKVAIVTAGTGGIGARLVAVYRERGWAVVASARTVGPSPDPDLLNIAGDVADPVTADRIVGGALKRFGRIDTLVNNAGIYLSKPFTDYTPADYAVTEASLAAFFWPTQRAITEMATRYGGHVISVLATTADIADSDAPAVLAALTRGSQVAVTRSLALEYACLGIRVNAVVPGIIKTPLPPARSRDVYGGRLPPLPRAGQISDIVNAVLFLESSPYITGEVVHVDGGQNRAWI